MNTDDLIASLSAGVRPVSRASVSVRLAWGLGIGLAASLVLVIATIGIRPDLDAAIERPGMWMKWGYALSIGGVAMFAAARLARPEPLSLGQLWWLAVPVLGLSLAGTAELMRSPPAMWMPMWMGHSWRDCPWRVLMAAVPILAGLLWSLRRMAPTRLRAAGAAAGLAAGGIAAAVYCLHCTEASAIFVLTWYSIGILLPTALGALLGPRLLRW